MITEDSCCNCAVTTHCVHHEYFLPTQSTPGGWCTDSFDQRSPIDFCIVSTELFSSVLDVRATRSATYVLKNNRAYQSHIGPGDPTE